MHPNKRVFIMMSVNIVSYRKLSDNLEALKVLINLKFVCINISLVRYAITARAALAPFDKATFKNRII